MEATANMEEDERPDDGEVEMNSTMINSLERSTYNSKK